MRLLRSSNAIAIFARPPVDGSAKTRLIPLLGAAGAAQFQAALIADAAHKVDALAARPEIVTPYLFLAEPVASDVAARLRWELELSGRAGWTILPQRGPDLGARLDLAFRTLLRQHVSAVIIGTDSPLLAPRAMRRALGELETCDAVLGPCPDGGYYLVGLGGRARADLGRRGVFARVRWGTAYAFRDTLRNLLEHGLSCSILEPVDDVDRPRDFLRLRREFIRHASARRLAPATWRFVRTRVGLAAQVRITSIDTRSLGSQPA